MNPPSHLPPHNISLGHPHAPAPSMLHHFYNTLMNLLLMHWINFTFLSVPSQLYFSPHHIISPLWLTLSVCVSVCVCVCACAFFTSKSLSSHLWELHSQYAANVFPLISTPKWHYSNSKLLRITKTSMLLNLIIFLKILLEK